MNSVNDKLPAAAVEAAIVDARHHAPRRHRRPGGRDPAKAATALRSAVGHMSMTAQAIAGATVTKFPEKF